MSNYEADLTDAIAWLRRWQKEYGYSFKEFNALHEAIELNLAAIEDIKFPGEQREAFRPDRRCSSCLAYAGPLDAQNECSLCARERRDEMRGYEP